MEIADISQSRLDTHEPMLSRQRPGHVKTALDENIVQYVMDQKPHSMPDFLSS